MRFLPIIFFLLFEIARSSAADGLFHLDKDSHPSTPLPDKIERATLSALSNENQKFALMLYRSKPFSVPPDEIGLVMGDKVVKECGHWSANQEFGIQFSLEGSEAVDAATRLFQPTVQKRRHPGHRMAVAFIPEKESYSTNEPVMVKLRITNVGNNKFVFMQGGRQRGSRDNQFAFTAQRGNKMLPDIGNPLNFGGLFGPVAVEAGQSKEIEVDLTKWFKFSEEGYYALRGSYGMGFYDSQVNGDPRFPEDFIWEDFACAEFSIQVKK